MTILPLVIAPDPRLNTPSKDIEIVDAKIRCLMLDMLETMYVNSGIGLAAVQVGHLINLLVMHIESPDKSKNPSEADLIPNNHDLKKPFFLINPKIIKSSEEISDYNEGCLSFPEQRVKISRPAEVIVEYIDCDGKKNTIDAKGLLATCIQHEMDHLKGVTLADRVVSSTKKQMIITKAAKVKPKY